MLSPEQTPCLPYNKPELPSSPHPPHTTKSFSEELFSSAFSHDFNHLFFLATHYSTPKYRLVDHVTLGDWNVFFHSLDKQDVTLVKFLLRKTPPNPYTISSKGCNALHVLSQVEHPSARKGEYLSLWKALETQFGETCILKLMNAENNDGQTPLHILATRGRMPHNEAISYFGFRLRINRTLNRQNKEGDTPSHCAARRGNLLALQLLLKYGSESSRTNFEGCDVVDIVRQRQTLELNRLLDKGKTVYSGFHLLKLPIELILHITSFVKYPQYLCPLSQTCKLMNTISSLDCFWDILCPPNGFSEMCPRFYSSKHHYIEWLRYMFRTYGDSWPRELTSPASSRASSTESLSDQEDIKMSSKLHQVSTQTCEPQNMAVPFQTIQKTDPTTNYDNYLCEDEGAMQLNLNLFIVGPTGVGKSFIRKRYVYGAVSGPGVKSGSDPMMLRYTVSAKPYISTQIWASSWSKIRSSYYPREDDVFVVVVDLSSPNVLRQLDQTLNEIGPRNHDSIILVGSKCDIANSESTKTMQEEANKRSITFQAVCSLNGMGIGEIFEHALKKSIEKQTQQRTTTYCPPRSIIKRYGHQKICERSLGVWPFKLN